MGRTRDGEGTKSARNGRKRRERRLGCEGRDGVGGAKRVSGSDGGDEGDGGDGGNGGWAIHEAYPKEGRAPIEMRSREGTSRVYICGAARA